MRRAEGAFTSNWARTMICSTRLQRRMLAIATLALSIALPAPTLAGKKICTEATLGASCNHHGKPGTCGRGECCRFDYQNRKPNSAPREVCAPCILCVVAAEPTELESLRPTFPVAASDHPSVGLENEATKTAKDAPNAIPNGLAVPATEAASTRLNRLL